MRNLLAFGAATLLALAGANSISGQPLEEEPNQAPTDISLNNNFVAEESDNVVVGTLSGVDPDGDALTYSVDHPQFSIDENRLVGTNIQSYEDQDSYSIQVTASDAEGASVTKTFTIQVLNVRGYLPEPGSVVQWGTEYSEFSEANVPADLRGVTVAIAAGRNHNLALKEDGTVVAWGESGGAELDVPPGLADVRSIAAGWNQSLALKYDGSLVAWGTTYVPDDLTNVAAIAAGDSQNLALRNDGTVVQWGGSFDGVVEGLNGVVTIASGDAYNAALKWDGTVVVWDQNNEWIDLPSSFTNNVKAIAAAANHVTVLKQDNTLEAFGDVYIPNSVEDAQAIATGEFHSLVLTEFGNLSGRSFAGGLGYEFEEEFEIAPKFNGVSAIAAGLHHSLAIVANIAPRDITLSNSSVSEDQPEYTEVGTFSAVDLDPSDIHTFELVDGEGSDDNWAFELIDDGFGPVLYTVEPFDYDSQSSYSIRIRVTDSAGLFLEKVFTITVEPQQNQAPTDILLNNGSVAENQPACATVGTLSVVDSDEGDTHTFSLVEGEGSSDNASFTIDGDTLKTAALFDFELKNSYSIRVRAIDAGGLSFEKTLAITIANVNEAPTEVILSNNFVAEESDYVVVGTLSGVDPDGDALTYTVDHHQFSIEGDRLIATGITDYEDRSSYSIQVTARDSEGASVAKTFTILVLNVNVSSPVAGSVVEWGNEYSEFSAANVPADLRGATVAVAAGHNHNLALKEDGTVVGWGSNDSGETDVPPGLTDVRSIAAGWGKSLALKYDGTVVSWGTTYVPEDLTNVAAIAAGDLQNLALKNDGTVVQWGGLVEGAVEGLNGVVAIASRFEYNMALKWDGTVVVWDQYNEWVEMPLRFTNNVKAIAAAAIHMTVLKDDNSLENTGDLVFPSVVEGAVAIATGENHALVLTESGELTGSYYWAAGLGFEFDGEFEAAPRFNGVSAIAAGHRHSLAIVANIAPLDITLSNSSVTEDQPEYTEVGTFSAVDLDPSDTYTFELVDGEGSDDNSVFDLEEYDSGITLVNNQPYDYDSQSSYSIRIRVTDSAGLFLEKVFTITVEPQQNQAPTDILLDNGSVAENQPAGTTVGTLSVVDSDEGDTHTFSLVEGEGSSDNSSFTIDGETLNTAASFNFEMKNSHSVRVLVMDSGGLSYEKVVLITVGNVNEAPTDISLSNNFVAEESDYVVVGTLSGVDPDGDALTYTVDHHQFSVEGDRLIATGIADYEDRSSYSIQVTATDTEGATVAEDFTIQVLNVRGYLPEPGTVVQWGTEYSEFSEANVPADLRGVTVAIAAGRNHNLALKEDGTVVAWGEYESDATDVPPGLTDVRSIAAGWGTSLALKYDGTLVAWGTAYVPDDLTNVAAVAAGDLQNLALKNDGTVVQWGGSFEGAVEGLNGVVAIASGSDYNVALKWDGTVVVWDQDNEWIDLPSSFTNNVKAIAAAANHVTVLKQDNTLETFGDVYIPNSVEDAQAIATGEFHSLVLTEFGNLSGRSFAGGLGYEFEEEFEIAPKFNGVSAIAAGLHHSLAIVANIAPLDITLSNSSVSEDQPEYTEVGTFSAVDLDPSDIHTFELVDGEGSDDNSVFDLEEYDSGITLVNNTPHDYDSQSSYSIRIRVTDSAGLFLEKVLTITVEPQQNQAPTDIVLNNGSVAENQPVGTVVGTLSAVDSDEGDTHTFSLVQGEGSSDNASFAIDGDTLKTAALFDFESKNSYSIRVQAIDAGGLSFEKTLAITIGNVAEPIIITVQPTSRSTAVGGSTTLSIVVLGDAPAYQWRKNGVPIENATHSSLEFSDFQIDNAARYDVEVSNGLGSVISDSAWLFASGAETTPPSVTVVSPKSNERITNSLHITISGTAKDIGLGVAQVFYSLNGGNYELADGTANWTASVSIHPGLNTVKIKAVDLAGNESNAVSRNFYAVIFSKLTLSITGSGSALGKASALGTPADQAQLEVGRSYTITATPAVDNLFSNWTGSASSDLAKLTFTMQSNMVLNANFVTNSFIAVSGVYNGLFSTSENVEFQSAGFVTAKVNAKQAVSGKLLLDGNAISFSGKMNVDGSISLVTKSRSKLGKPELNLTLHLDLNGADIMSGTVAQGDNWTSSLLAHRVVWTTNNPATDYINSYTMIITNGSQGPVGSGYGLISVDKIGKTRLAGHVADGHLLKQATVISQSGHWPLFSPMYVQSRSIGDKAIKETKGFLLGWLQFTNNNGVGNIAPAGEVHWIKTGWTNSTYQAGFSNIVEVTASRWLAPAPKGGERAIAMTDAVLSFTAGDLSSPFSATYLVTTNTTLAVIKPIAPGDYPNALNAALTPKNGLIKGTFTHPHGTGLPTKWFGAILQDQNLGAGFFMGPAIGGKVTFEDAADQP